MSQPRYPGKELEFFSHARNWKKYWSSLITTYLSGDVLEVGAGIGTNTPYLKSPEVSSWTCLEPDRLLAEKMRAEFSGHALLADCRIEMGTTESARFDRKFDAILYIDTLEHIPDDRAETQRAAQLLRTSGRLIALSPACPWLYSPFDRAIGHVRRYTASSTRSCTPAGCRLHRLMHLDSAGMLASAANRLLLEQSMPTLRQILFWDRCLVPLSRVTDGLTLHTFGKSILAIWIKT